MIQKLIINTLTLISYSIIEELLLSPNKIIVDKYIFYSYLVNKNVNPFTREYIDKEILDELNETEESKNILNNFRIELNDKIMNKKHLKKIEFIYTQISIVIMSNYSTQLPLSLTMNIFQSAHFSDKKDAFIVFLNCRPNLY